MIQICFLFAILSTFSPAGSKYFLPINTTERRSVKTLKITEIGGFGIIRKERPGIRAHYHSGIDIQRPVENYTEEPIYPVSEGLVISIRKDGPYAQIIIEHGTSEKFWTIYEHIAGIKVALNEWVDPNKPIARFMNRKELDKYGWQFNHFHLEILKICPVRINYDKSNPERKFNSYSLNCFTKADLLRYFYDPVEFLRDRCNHKW